VVEDQEQIGGTEKKRSWCFVTGQEEACVFRRKEGGVVDLASLRGTRLANGASLRGTRSATISRSCFWYVLVYSVGLKSYAI
jgi:hypothetical protein